MKIEQIVALDIVLNKFIKNLTKENSNLIKNTQINLVEEFESFILFESILTPQGSIYQPLKEYVI